MQQKDIFWFGPILALLIAILPMPIGYYTLSRIIVFGGSVYFSYNFYKRNDVALTWLFGLCALLYNPIFPIYLYDRVIWTVLNILTIIMFWTQRKKI